MEENLKNYICELIEGLGINNKIENLDTITYEKDIVLTTPPQIIMVNNIQKMIEGQKYTVKIIFEIIEGNGVIDDEGNIVNEMMGLYMKASNKMDIISEFHVLIDNYKEASMYINGFIHNIR